jgi:cytochrome c oxidase cbb3-type subunit I/II
MEDPTSTTPQSIMPPYPWLLTNRLDFASIQPRVDAMTMLGVPYGNAVLHAEAMARAQARTVAGRIQSQGGPEGLQDKQIVALVAYLERLGTDIKGRPAEAAPNELQARESGEGAVHTRALSNAASSLEVKP